MRIAILGAGSHVSRAILPHLLAHSAFDVHLYTRLPDRLLDWAMTQALPVERFSVEETSNFGERACDAVVNLVGAGDPRLVAELGQQILPLTAEWDRRATGFVRRRPSTRYVFFSSGVATGHDFAAPWSPVDTLVMPPSDQPYARAKAIAEQEHRALRDLAIADLRLYGFYAAEMRGDLAYLMCQIVRKIETDQILVTDQHDITRDYVAPADLAAALAATLAATPCNKAFDLVSRAPVRKFDLLRHFRSRHGLNWDVHPAGSGPNKLNYYATRSDLSDFGFLASMTSLEAVTAEATAALVGCGSL